MTSYRKKSVVIEATQWFKNGDHPQDDCVPVRRLGPNDPVTGDVRTQTGELVPDPVTDAPSFLCEGRVVRYFRHPGVSGEVICPACGIRMHEHGWMEKEDRNVCPGDWIVTGPDGRWPCKPAVFAEMYEAAL